MAEGMNDVEASDADVEDVVRKFYDRYGWVKAGTQLGEEAMFRQFPLYYFSFYESKSRKRVLSCFDGSTGKLLIAGCGDMPDSHVEATRRFTEVSCLDISDQALSAAAAKLGEKVRYIHGSILRAPLPDNAFDAVFCAHVLFHIDAGEQSQAVRELIRVTKPGGKIVIVYSNPDSVFALQFWKRSWVFRALASRARKPKTETSPAVPDLYFACHPFHWWRQFEPQCMIRFLPADIMGSRQAMLLLKSRIAAVLVYRTAAWLEQVTPALAVRLWQYPLVVLQKRA